MSNRSQLRCCLGGVVIILCVWATFGAGVTLAGEVAPFSRIDGSSNQSTIVVGEGQITEAGEKTAYAGKLRIYVMEPSGRWKYDNGGATIEHAFVGFAVDEVLCLRDSYSGSVVYYTPFTVTSGNIAAVGAVFNPTPHAAYADPPSANPFTAYWVDACATAKPGIPGTDTASLGYTHTVMVEQGTATWCPYCPATATALKQLYALGTYNFQYIALVGDMITQADTRLDQMNCAGYPSCFMDGGHGVIVGGYSSMVPYRDLINPAGQRTVPDIDLDITMTYIDNRHLQIDYVVTNHEWTNSAPNDPAAPTGDNLCPRGESTNSTCSATDPDCHQVYLKMDFGDGTITEWYGPYAGGSPWTDAHQWNTRGVFEIKSQAKDELDVESGWSPTMSLEVFECGDFNDDGTVNIIDIINLINYKFKNGAAPRLLDAVNTNQDAAVNILDVIVLIDYKFKAGAAPNCP